MVTLERINAPTGHETTSPIADSALAQPTPSPHVAEYKPKVVALDGIRLGMTQTEVEERFQYPWVRTYQQNCLHVELVGANIWRKCFFNPKGEVGRVLALGFVLRLEGKEKALHWQSKTADVRNLLGLPDTMDGSEWTYKDLGLRVWIVRGNLDRVELNEQFKAQ